MAAEAKMCCSVAEFRLIVIHGVIISGMNAKLCQEKTELFRQRYIKSMVKSYFHGRQHPIMARLKSVYLKLDF